MLLPEAGVILFLLPPLPSNFGPLPTQLGRSQLALGFLPGRSHLLLHANLAASCHKEGFPDGWEAFHTG